LVQEGISKQLELEKSLKDDLERLTVTNVMKEVVIEGGATIKAPLFIEAGDAIRIDTRTGSYVERA